MMKNSAHQTKSVVLWLHLSLLTIQMLQKSAGRGEKWNNLEWERAGQKLCNCQQLSLYLSFQYHEM